MDLYFDWENADVEYKDFRRPEGKAPGYKIYVTIYDQQTDDNTGELTLTNGIELEIQVAQSEEDPTKVLLNDLKLGAIRVSLYFASVRNSLRTGQKTYEQVFDNWKQQFSTCPDNDNLSVDGQ